MPKLVEGQLGQMQMTSYFSKNSHSVASSNLRKYVSMVTDQQSKYPDVVSRNVDVRSTIESDTGRVISSSA